MVYNCFYMGGLTVLWISNNSLWLLGVNEFFMVAHSVIGFHHHKNPSFQLVFPFLCGYC